MSTKRTARPCAAAYEAQAGEYFEWCQETGRHPSLPGLALALGLEGRAQLELFSTYGTGTQVTVILPRTE